jgi:hypothetical protein
MFASLSSSIAKFANQGRRPATVWNTLFGLLACAMFAILPSSQAQAEIVNFWDDADKPSLTGRAPKSAARVARAARHAERNDEARSSKKSRNTRVASRGRSDASELPRRKSLSGGGSISWSAPSGCLNGDIKSALRDLASSYGPVTVTSTCRDKSHNARVGGAKKSQHLTGDAADFRVSGSPSRVLASLRSSGMGGVKHYGGGLYHADTGPSRTW